MFRSAWIKVGWVLLVGCCFSLHQAVAQPGGSPVDLSPEMQKYIQEYIRQQGMSSSTIEDLSSILGVGKEQLLQVVGQFGDSDSPMGAEGLGGPKRSAIPLRPMGPERLEDETVPLFPVYGLSLFKGAQQDFTPTVAIPTPREYELGPMDEIIINVWGASEHRYLLILDRASRITVPGVGPLFLGGMSIEEAEQYLRKRLSVIYAGLLPGAGQQTFLSITLESLRTVAVNVLGEAKYPGTYFVSAASTLFNVLYYAGGPNQSGSTRNIILQRNGQIVARFDLYKYLAGDWEADMNPIVKNNDMVIITPYLTHIKVRNPLRRQGIYEIKPQERVSDLLKYVGGFLESAYPSQLRISRNEQGQKAFYTVPDSLYADFALQNGDEVAAFEIMSAYLNRVSIQGAVKRPGYYQLQDSMNVRQLVELAGGLTEEAYLGRGVLKRREADYSYSQRSFHVGKVLSGSAPDILLHNADSIQVFTQTILMEAPTVVIHGEIRFKGTYPYRSGMTIKELVLQAGGFTHLSQGAQIEVVSKETKSGDPIIKNYSMSAGFAVDGEEEFVLKPYDEIFVRQIPDYQKSSYVLVTGEVLYPGIYALEGSTESLSNILARAGGVSPRAYVQGASLHRSFRDRMFEMLDIFLADSVTDVIPRLDVVRVEQAQQLWRLAQNQAIQNKVEAILKSQGDPSSVYTEDADQEKATAQMYSFISSLDIRQDSLLTYMLCVLSDSYLVDVQVDKLLPSNKYDILIQDGDRLHVPSGLQFVRVQTGVNNPTAVRYDDKWSVRKYVRAAGGFHPRAKASRLYVRYANGSIRSTKRFIFRDYPEVLPGAEIIVPLRTEQRRKVSTAEVIAITSSLTSMAILIGNFILNVR